jgi:TM2 domain-containing membrane protein YozV
MTEPQYGSGPSEGVTPPQQPWEYPAPPQAGEYPPPPGQYPPQDQYQYPPPPGAYYDPMAPYGRHPVTGEPFSDKSKVIAGLLQLVGLFGLVGFGRIYLGQTGLGVAQLIVGLVTCGIGAWIWGIIDAVMIFSGRVRDNAGRPLRDGT